ncbi:MAG: sigma-70 family RNA polymerase sigma factor [Planctomycetaceae bacterium]|nr:sigma-70 family RNA polymerase sigma factor [Planctomycetaceae bacterium]
MNLTESDSSRRPGRFATTQWSLVVAAAEHRAAAFGQDKAAAAALESLCRSYWLPLYAYAKRRERNVEDARDLTQQFFAELLEKNFLAAADPGRGRFRTFLLTAFQNFLSKDYARRETRRRGGGRQILSLDFTSGDSQMTFEPTIDQTPEQIFDRQWAMTLLQNVVDRLKEEYQAAGKAGQFAALKDTITGRSHNVPLASAAEQLGMTEAAAKMAAHRLRRRYRDLLRQEIAETVASPRDVDAEIRSLFALFE